MDEVREKCAKIPDLPGNLRKSSQIGPALPPYMIKTRCETSHTYSLPQRQEGNSDLQSTSEQSGEQQSQMLHKSTEDVALSCSGQGESVISKSSFGPELPPHLRKNIQQVSECPKNDEKSVGPILPPHLRKQLQEQAERNSQEDIIDSEDDQETYGPLPVGMSKYSASEIALEERALQLQIDQLGTSENNTPIRESWMTDLPEAKAVNFGLGPRQFRNRAGPDLSDRSSWTDVPGEKSEHKSKKKTVDLKSEAELRESQKRDMEQDLLTKKHKRKSKSLIDMHQEKLRKKAGTVDTSERIPFNRETDLQVNKFDEAQRKAVLKKAQLLDDRFSTGKTKYL